MSWSREVTIWCDAEDCGEWQQLAETVTHARATLRRTGWTHRGRKDYCPRHGAKDPEKS